MARSTKPSGKVFRDPVHTLIRVDPDDEFIVDLIDTPEFQRLRRVRQLGVSSLTYPGAEHSRFVHSLGVFNFAQRILESLKRRYRLNSEISDRLDEGSRVVKAAALLHDIGHGPYSHMIERAFSKNSNHETKTREIICNTDSGVNQVLLGAGLDPQRVASIIDKDADLLLCDIVSSQLDADRMDYLLRDSHATGVEYGRFDAEWLLNALCIGQDPVAGSGIQRLCLHRDQGWYAAEQFLLARAHMSEQVYFHRVTRGFEAMLLALFSRASEMAIADELPQNTLPIIKRYLKTQGQIDDSDWLRLDESVFASTFHEWGGADDSGVLAEFAGAFVNRKCLFKSVDLKGGIEFEFFESLNNAAVNKGEDWLFDEANFTVYKGLLAGINKAKDEEEAVAEGLFFSSGETGSRAVPAENSSPRIGRLLEGGSSWKRLYYRKSKEAEFESILKKHKLWKG